MFFWMMIDRPCESLPVSFRCCYAEHSAYLLSLIKNSAQPFLWPAFAAPAWGVARSRKQAEMSKLSAEVAQQRPIWEQAKQREQVHQVEVRTNEYVPGARNPHEPASLFLWRSFAQSINHSFAVKEGCMQA